MRVDAITVTSIEYVSPGSLILMPERGAFALVIAAGNHDHRLALPLNWDHPSALLPFFAPQESVVDLGLDTYLRFELTAASVTMPSASGIEGAIIVNGGRAFLRFKATPHTPLPLVDVGSGLLVGSFDQANVSTVVHDWKIFASIEAHNLKLPALVTRTKPLGAD